MHEALEQVLLGISRPVIAVSGGVDSVTLAALASRMGLDAGVMHATSPAVPAEATARVRALAEELGWDLTVVSAGEFDDPNYRANPVNRCFYCKTNLYGTIRRRTPRQILSGANRDDLGEYRPGLDAAREHGVRHPYVEAGLDKGAVRRLARDLGLHAVAALPSSPCLSSRVETGIRIEASTLDLIHRIERALARRLPASTIRCRMRASGIVVELDSTTLSASTSDTLHRLSRIVNAQARQRDDAPVTFAEYRNGSAFLTDHAT